MHRGVPNVLAYSLCSPLLSSSKPALTCTIIVSTAPSRHSVTGRNVSQCLPGPPQSAEDTGLERRETALSESVNYKPHPPHDPHSTSTPLFLTLTLTFSFSFQTLSCLFLSFFNFFSFYIKDTLPLPPPVFTLWL